jgi:hypothetical protein
MKRQRGFRVRIVGHCHRSCRQACNTQAVKLGAAELYTRRLGKSCALHGRNLP